MKYEHMNEGNEMKARLLKILIVLSGQFPYLGFDGVRLQSSGQAFSTSMSKFTDISDIGAIQK